MLDEARRVTQAISEKSVGMLRKDEVTPTLLTTVTDSYCPSCISLYRYDSLYLDVGKSFFLKQQMTKKSKISTKALSTPPFIIDRQERS